jgi:hypothetical protein
MSSELLFIDIYQKYVEGINVSRLPVEEKTIRCHARFRVRVRQSVSPQNPNSQRRCPIKRAPNTTNGAPRSSCSKGRDGVNARRAH